jgi:6-pyruvoyltetrahydropterin/6-carboxytetrahydropterin synthase
VTFPPTPEDTSPSPAISQALLHTDGGSRGNPGESGIGFTLDIDDGRQLVTICRGGAYIGIATNNVAEYRALIWGLRNALQLKIRRIEVRADSELLVKQLLGVYRVKNIGIKPLFVEACQLLESFDTFTVKHVPREQNSAADKLANEAMDTRGMVGDYAVSYDAGDLFSVASPSASVASASAPVLDTEATDAPAPSLDSEFTSEAGGVSVLPSTPSSLAPRDDDRKGTTMTDSPAVGTYTLTIKEHFDAAHALIGYPGQCRNLHGHTWDVEVSVKGSELDEVGIVYDFKDLKDNLRSILERYDHSYLNGVPPFDAMNATAENLARVIYEQMEILLPEGISLVEVAVWESPIARLSYTR